MHIYRNNNLYNNIYIVNNNIYFYNNIIVFKIFVLSEKYIAYFL